jgi:hypothetical protein
MYAAEHILDSLTYEDLYYTLKSTIEEDLYLKDHLGDNLVEDFLYMLDVCDLIYISSDDRILLTGKGEKTLQYIGPKVELERKSSKVKKKKKI